MKISTSLNIYAPHGGDIGVDDYINNLKIAVKCGFEAFDFNCWDYKMEGSWYSADNWRDNVKLIKEAAQSLGAEFYQSHTAMITHVLTENTEETLAEINKSIEAAALVGAKWTAIHCFNTGIRDEEEDIAKNIELLAPYAEFASKMGVGLAVENNPERLYRFTKRHDLGNFHKTENILRVSTALNGRFGNVGICWDTGHANLTYQDQYDELIQLGKNLKIMHIANNYRQEDNHLIPFYGEADFKQIMKALHEIGYEGTFNYEAHRFTGDLPAELVDDAVAFMYKVAKYIVDNY